MLIFDALINGEKDAKSGCFRRCEQFTILQASQSSETGGLAIVTDEKFPESLVDTFVDQNAHLRTCEQKLLRFFERSDGHFTRDGRKPLQKIFECFSTFQVVEHRLDRHASPPEHRSSPENVAIFNDDSHGKIVPRALAAQAQAPKRIWAPSSAFDGAPRFLTFNLLNCKPANVLCYPAQKDYPISIVILSERSEPKDLSSNSRCLTSSIQTSYDFTGHTLAICYNYFVWSAPSSRAYP